jgi:hypothetical protein
MESKKDRPLSATTFMVIASNFTFDRHKPARETTQSSKPHTH